MEFDPDTQQNTPYFPADDDDDDDDDEEYLACPRCGSDGVFDYIGESYDDEQHLGSCYKCVECGFEFTAGDE